MTWTAPCGHPGVPIIGTYVKCMICDVKPKVKPEPARYFMSLCRNSPLVTNSDENDMARFELDSTNVEAYVASAGSNARPKLMRLPLGAQNYLDITKPGIITYVRITRLDNVEVYCALVGSKVQLADGRLYSNDIQSFLNSCL